MTQPDTKPFVLGMINARWLQGVPRKNIRILGKKPLIAWTIDIAKQVPQPHAALFQLKMKKLRKLQMLLVPKFPLCNQQN